MLTSTIPPPVLLLIKTLPVLAIVILFITLANNSISGKSATFDEMAHITAGYSYLKTGDFRLNPQNGVLPQVIAATPLLFQDLSFSTSNNTAWENRDLWGLSDHFFHGSGNDTITMLQSARRMIIIVGVLAGLAVFIWAYKLWGYSAALFSLLIYSLSPTILANTRLATSDMTVTLCFLLAVGSVWRLSHQISIMNIAAAGIAIGMLAISKMSAILILPISLAILILRYYYGPNPELKINTKSIPRTAVYTLSIILVCTISIGIINVVYFSHPEKVLFNSQISGQLPWFSGSFVRAIELSQLLPEPYLYGLTFTLAHTEHRLSFANGMYSLNGWWWFFPFTFLVKTPLSILAGSIYAGFKARSITFQRSLYDAVPLLLFILMYGGFAVISHLNIGHRHLMPIYPPLFILLGIIAFNVTGRKLLYPIVIAGWLALESIGNHPNYISFFNKAFGGPENGYHLLVDSSLDWGQDLPSLRDWLKHNDGEPVYLAYFGTASPETYHITSRRLPGFLDRSYTPDTSPLEAGTYIISATLLQLVFQPPEAFGPWYPIQETHYQKLAEIYGYNAAKLDSLNYAPGQYRQYDRLRFGRLCHYLRNRQPDNQIGHSLLVYHLDDSELKTALEATSDDHNPLTAF